MEKEYVYVISEEGSWDYEFTNNIEVYSNFDKALKAFKELVEYAKSSINNFVDEDEIAIEENINEQKEIAEFYIYEDGDFTKTHDTIRISKQMIK